MEHCDTMDMPQQNRDGDIECVTNSCARMVNENEKQGHFSSQQQAQLVPNDTLYDSLPVDETVIGNMQVLTAHNINEDKPQQKTNSCVPSNDDDDKQTKECSDDMQTPSALSQLLNYGVSDTDEDSESDSDDSTNDDVVVKPCLTTETNPSDHEPPVVQTNNFRENDSSSDSSSTSEYESDSSSSYSDVGACGVTPAASAAPEKKQTAEKYSVPRTKGELSMDELPPIEDLKISVAEEECIEIGVVSSIIDQLVIVQSLPGTPAYDLDTLFFLDRGNRPLGRVFDVIGPVTEPFYAVRFNTCEQAVESGAKPGTPVYCAPHTQHTSYVFVSELMKLKGSDASWEHNNEPPAAYLDYSDDEEERKARRVQRAKVTQAAVDTPPPPKSSSLERNKKFEKQMNDKNLLITERYKNQQPPARKKKPDTTRPAAAVNTVQLPPPWMVPAAAPMPPPARAEFWSAPPYHFAAYPPYGQVPMFGPRQPFVPPPAAAAVFHAPPQHFNPNIPPPIMRPQPVPYFPNPRHPRWVTPGGLGVLQPPRGNFGGGNGSSYTH